MRAAELVRQPGPRGGSERGKNAAWGKGAFLGEEAVVADSGWAGEVASRRTRLL